MTRLFLVLLMTAILNALPSAEMEIPVGISYKTTSDDINNKGMEFIHGILSSKGIERNQAAGELFICGPALWKNISSKINAKDEGLIPNSVLSVPIPDAEPQSLKVGIWLKGQPISAILKESIDKEIGDEKLTLRKLNSKELTIHWAMIGWDIQEPIFIAEAKGHAYLFALGVKDGRYHISFLDDMSGYK